MVIANSQGIAGRDPVFHLSLRFFCCSDLPLRETHEHTSYYQLGDLQRRGICTSQGVLKLSKVIYPPS